jgi:hypothetical protein
VATSVELEDLIGAFRAEPVSQDNQEYWPYAQARFEYGTKDCTLVFDVSPGYEEAHLVLLLTGAVPVVDLKLKDIARIEVEQLHDMEALRLHFRRSEPPSCTSGSVRMY